MNKDFKLSILNFTNSVAKRVIYFLYCLGTSNEQDDRESDGIDIARMGKLSAELGLHEEMINLKRIHNFLKFTNSL